MDPETAKTQEEREKMEQQFASLHLYGSNNNNNNKNPFEGYYYEQLVEENFYAMETTPTPLENHLYAIPEEKNMGQQQFDVPMKLPFGQPFIKPGDFEFFGILSNEEMLSPEEQKERQVLKLLFNVKYGTPEQREIAWRELTDTAHEFGGRTLMRPILRLLMQFAWEDDGETLFLVEVIVRLLSKLDELVYPYVCPILVLVKPWLLDEDHNVREAGRVIVYNLSKAAGSATMIALLSSGIVDRDEYVRNATAIAFSVVASALGIPALLPFLKDVCQIDKSWQVRHTGIKIVHQIAILMGHGVVQHSKFLVEIIEHGLKDENQEVRNITALALAEMAAQSFGKQLSEIFV